MTKEFYEGECKRIERIAKIHMPKCFELYDELEQKVVKKEMAVGVECCPRGFYCLSPTLNIRVGGIKECGFYEYNSFENKITEISKETYEYSENKLEMTSETFSPGISISDGFKEILGINSDADDMDVLLKSTFEKSKYIFDVKDGFLKSYVVEDYYDNGKRKASVWDGHQFKVYLKRRANKYVE